MPLKDTSFQSPRKASFIELYGKFRQNFHRVMPKGLDKKFSGCHCEMYHAEYNCGGAAFCERAQQNFGGCNFEFWLEHTRRKQS